MKKKFLGLVLALSVSAFGMSAMAAEADATEVEAAAVEAVEANASAVYESDHQETVAPTGAHTHGYLGESNGAYLSETLTEATCTSTGVDIYRCNLKDQDGNNAGVFVHYVITPMKEHTPSAWIVDVEPTCGEYGKAHKECTVCGKILTEDLKFDPAGEKDQQHQWDEWSTEKAATCSSQGSEIRTCSVCHTIERRLTDPLKPQWEVLSKKRVNCFEYVVTKRCAACKGKVEGHGKVTEVTKATSHDYSEEKKYEVARKEATCEADGYVLYRCIFCTGEYSNVFDATEAITGTLKTNQLLYDGATAAPAHPVKKVVLPAKGHNFSAWTETRKLDPEKGQNGIFVRTCADCNKSEYKVVTSQADIDALNRRNGLAQDNDGTFKYFKDDVVDTTFTGIAKYNGNEFFVTKGIMDATANGLNLNAADGKWYFLAAGKVTRGEGGFAMYNNAWFMLKNGELNVDANGLYDYNGAKFAFAAGKLITDVNGLWYAPNTEEWYYLQNGQLQENYTGTATYGGATFNVVNGVVA